MSAPVAPLGPQLGQRAPAAPAAADWAAVKPLCHRCCAAGCLNSPAAPPAASAGLPAFSLPSPCARPACANVLCCDIDTLRRSVCITMPLPSHALHGSGWLAQQAAPASTRGLGLPPQCVLNKPAPFVCAFHSAPVLPAYLVCLACWAAAPFAAPASVCLCLLVLSCSFHAAYAASLRLSRCSPLCLTSLPLLAPFPPHK